MGFRRKLKGWFLSFFREIFVYHNSSPEFRAKLLAAVIGANKDMDGCELELLVQVAKEIYPDDEARVDVLVHTTKEYVKKIIENNGLDLNELILSINQDLKTVKRYHQKINVNRLRRFLVCSEKDEETYTIQIRIIEFLDSAMQEFQQNSVK